MKNFKRIMAVTAAGTMLLSSTSVFAANSATSNEVNGSGSIEQDDSTVPSYTNIVLPTMTAAQYSFILDPSGLLNEYNPDEYPDAGTVYFKAVKTAATLTNKEDGTASDQKLYYSTKTAEADLDNLKAALTVASSDITAITKDFYLWVPDPDSSTAGGKYLKLDVAGVKKYFEIEYAADGSSITAIDFKNTKVEASACNGKVYADALTALPAAHNVADYVTIKADGSVDLDAAINNLYTKSKDGNTNIAIDKTNFDTYVKYTPPVVSTQGASDKATVVNKSTDSTIVTVKVTVEDAPGLLFNSSSTFAADNTDTSMYLAIKNEASSDGDVTAGAEPVATVNEVSSATATYELNGADESNALKYQKTDIDTVTGSHKYGIFEAPDVGYDSIAFNLEGVANKHDDAKWDEYAAGLTSKPTVNVVYSVAAKSTDRMLTPTTVDGSTALAYQFTSNVPSGSLTAVSVDGTDAQGAMSAGNITYNTDTLLIKTGPVNNFKFMDPGTHTVVATIGGTEYTFKYVVSDNYTMTLAGGEVSYTFNTAPAGSLTILNVDNVDREGAITNNNVTYNPSTGVLKFNATSVGGCGLSTVGVHTIKATIGGVVYTLTYTQA